MCRNTLNDPGQSNGRPDMKTAETIVGAQVPPTADYAYREFSELAGPFADAGPDYRVDFVRDP